MLIIPMTLMPMYRFLVRLVFETTTEHGVLARLLRGETRPVGLALPTTRKLLESAFLEAQFRPLTKLQPLTMASRTCPSTAAVGALATMAKQWKVPAISSEKLWSMELTRAGMERDLFSFLPAVMVDGTTTNAILMVIRTVYIRSLYHLSTTWAFIRTILKPVPPIWSWRTVLVVETISYVLPKNGYKFLKLKFLRLPQTEEMNVQSAMAVPLRLLRMLLESLLWPFKHGKICG